MEKQPLISVLLPVYNCEETLAEAIESITSQTYPNWEMIICDDGSTDASYVIAERYAGQLPGKVVLIKNKQNMGLNYTLNHCFEHSRGELIARMDGDDVCSPERFQIELNALENHPEISFVSTDMDFFDETGTWGTIWHPDFPTAEDLVRDNPFCHAPCMIRREAFESVDGYTVDEKLLRVEDYHLWIKMYVHGKRGMNIHQALYSMRDNQNADNRRRFKYRLNEAHVMRLAVKELRMPKWMIIYSLRPIIVGLMPNIIYRPLHKRRLNRLQCSKHIVF